MLVEVTPILPDAGVPPLEDMDRYEQGMAGLDGAWDFVKGTIDKTIDKLEIPGFGTPLVAPGTVIQTPQGTTVRQQTGYPVSVPVPQTASRTEFSLGAGVMLAGAAVLIGLVAISRGGKK